MIAVAWYFFTTGICQRARTVLVVNLSSDHWVGAELARENGFLRYRRVDASSLAFGRTCSCPVWGRSFCYTKFFSLVLFSVFRCGWYPLGIYTRFMRLAANPAPKPLSILTTVMPDAHELSIARSAASPLKLAPYPTLVGTAMTGLSMSPATTLGNAPSMPAITITTDAAYNCCRFPKRR